MGIIKLPIVINHDDLHRMIDEKIAELKAQYIPKADYENRLKADMVAMLTDIQLEIKELWDSRYDVWLDNQYYIGKSDTLEEVDEVIQQKIDALKEVVEDGK